MMPTDVLPVSVIDLVTMLESHWGDSLYQAFDPNESITSPLHGNQDTVWMKRANTVGINVRTIQNFWNIIPYALTLPAAQDTIHILPIWECGVVASLYGPASWNINPEFYCAELAEAFPHLNTVERQLKVVINILHLMGKRVGMDVVPHTDRYSEMAIANPSYFEWLQRRDLTIVRHHSDLYREVEAIIYEYTKDRGAADLHIPFPNQETDFFENIKERERLRLLFGDKSDYEGRLSRRKEYVELLYQMGYETVPATMGPPYRGIEVDPDPSALTTDEEGRVWRDYRIIKPQKFSRAFGPLARYKLYGALDNNTHWDLDFSKPNVPAWEYVCERYAEIQRYFNFDFMRGDMSHVQMRPAGVPLERDAFYDLLGAVKQYVLPEKPYFAYFAESFLAPPNEMAYGDECDHLEASFADSTLGDLQSEPIGTTQFVKLFAQYNVWLETRKFAPNFTIMTADKDDPRFDAFYLKGNETRYFIALFLTDMPSYMGLGFECRDPHPSPAPNEHYTKLYVFQVNEGTKSTKGRYIWGTNRKLYAGLQRQKEIANEIWPLIKDADTQWLIPPDATGQNKVIAWTQKDNPSFVFIVNLDTEHAVTSLTIDIEGSKEWRGAFSTIQEDFATVPSKKINLEQLLPSEGIIFSLIQSA